MTCPDMRASDMLFPGTHRPRRTVLPLSRRSLEDRIEILDRIGQQICGHGGRDPLLGHEGADAGEQTREAAVERFWILLHELGNACDGDVVVVAKTQDELILRL